MMLDVQRTRTLLMSIGSCWCQQGRCAASGPLPRSRAKSIPTPSAGAADANNGDSHASFCCESGSIATRRERPQNCFRKTIVYKRVRLAGSNRGNPGTGEPGTFSKTTYLSDQRIRLTFTSLVDSGDVVYLRTRIRLRRRVAGSSSQLALQTAPPLLIPTRSR